MARPTSVISAGQITTIVLNGLGLAVVLLTYLSAASAQLQERQVKPIATALQSREFARALELLRPALQASPGNAQLWAMQGTAYAGEGHTKEALVSFRGALKISPDNLPALEGAIQIEYEAGSGPRFHSCSVCCDCGPPMHTSHGMLAVLEYQQGNCRAAVVHFEKSGTLFDPSPGAACICYLPGEAQAASIRPQKYFSKQWL